jgi:phosphoribosylformylglycinamidine (FGAM) synthase-like amidotransferase family enzyme
MPHPEHAVDVLTGSDDGLRIFESMRAQIADRVPA